jgi:hypothetical protein
MVAMTTVSTVALSSTAPTGDQGYDPCAGRECGDVCEHCPPTDGDCVEDPVVKTCDAEGNCRQPQGDEDCRRPASSC